jgi:hypothetical protein
MEIVNTDSAASLSLYFRKGRESVPKTFSVFDEADDAYSLAGLNFQMNFKTHENAATNLFQLTDGAGLTVGASTISFQVTAAQSIIPTKEIIWWELKETTTNRTWVAKHGAYFFYGDPKETTDITEITVKLSADIIRLTITSGEGGTGGGITEVDGGTI